jgi:hypothetical protein
VRAVAARGAVVGDRGAPVLGVVAAAGAVAAARAVLRDGGLGVVTAGRAVASGGPVVGGGAGIVVVRILVVDVDQRPGVVLAQLDVLELGRTLGSAPTDREADAADRHHAAQRQYCQSSDAHLSSFDRDPRSEDPPRR